jgi:hypothetical protein
MFGGASAIRAQETTADARPRSNRLVGIEEEEAPAVAEAALDRRPLTTRAVSDSICDECSHLERDTNHCRVHNRERSFDAPACRFLYRREAE